MLEMLNPDLDDESYFWMSYEDFSKTFQAVVTIETTLIPVFSFEEGNFYSNQGAI
jgi:hypothetical protein